jgi:hypothetical protein
MTRNACFPRGPPGGIVSHFVGRVYEPYIRVTVDGFTCSQEVDDLTDGPVNQLSMDKVLKFHFHQTDQSVCRKTIPP